MGITVDETKPATVENVRVAKGDYEKVISNYLRQFQREYGVRVTGIEEDISVSTTSGLGINSVRLRVEL